MHMLPFYIPECGVPTFSLVGVNSSTFVLSPCESSGIPGIQYLNYINSANGLLAISEISYYILLLLS